ncbi:SOS response-associated peptidase [Frankia sp. Mgl5]|uniref:SOS response-associated peptidase n=1 Tax=Frankia sp. Mgl5 TaxID=2933793 RepID=UPI0020108124|nr:SOS response-associated peptidase [Frankia sp. Mgl5]MCK9930176.1 SOS response-associated peptidase [Frankia sp. Mgl5]
MCGRYTQTLSADDLAAAMSAADETGGRVTESYNVAPTTVMPIVVARRPPGGAGHGEPAAGAGTGGAGESGEAGETGGGGGPRAAGGGRVLRLATWGLVPFWAKDPAIGSRLINARAESVASKPAFRAAFAARRCLVPATGFYEWRRPGGSRRGQPYYIHPAGHPGADGLFAFAGLYEVWSKGEQPLTTFTILTTDAAAGIEFIHDRSPVVVPRPAWSRWIDPTLRDPEALAGILRPAPAGVFAAHPVSPEVGSVRNTGRHLVDPVDVDPEEAAAAAGPPATAGPSRARRAGRATPVAKPASVAGPTSVAEPPPGVGVIAPHEVGLFGEDGVGPHARR